MTLIETLVAMTVAVGVVVVGLESARQSIERTNLSALETEASLRAEALMGRVGADVPLAPGRREGSDEDIGRWSLDIRLDEASSRRLAAYHIVASVSVTRGQRSASSTLETLKLKAGTGP